MAWIEETIQTSLHLTSIVNIHYDKSVKFEEFMASKHEHNHLLKELGRTSLSNSYIAILIHSSLPKHLKQTVAHIPDDTISTDQLVNMIQSCQQELMIQNMQSTSSNTALFRRQSKQKKRNF